MNHELSLHTGVTESAKNTALESHSSGFSRHVFDVAVSPAISKPCSRSQGCDLEDDPGVRIDFHHVGENLFSLAVIFTSLLSAPWGIIAWDRMGGEANSINRASRLRTINFFTASPSQSILIADREGHLGLGASMAGKEAWYRRQCIADALPQSSLFLGNPPGQYPCIGQREDHCRTISAAKDGNGNKFNDDCQIVRVPDQAVWPPRHQFHFGQNDNSCIPMPAQCQDRPKAHGLRPCQQPKPNRPQGIPAV